ncbi:TAXI family TRAP transporter solute-binding subunit [Natrinema gelatinilyticum]|uniref:TAXI family TRAP transporter solute-binding subunit n=1 Tax=Natrinema gelatinilyticum TaxID=2961571 RepID=UPI0021140071|nr:TAXI family TRAP transporter solute-binding subunit [Natrinema gelatinilyticum]
MFDSERQRRRDVLRGTAGIGALSLAGCLGGGNGSGEDPVQLTVGSSSSGSSTYGNSQAIQRVVSQQSDYLSFITQDAGGDPQSIRLYADGEINSYSAGNYIMNQALSGTGPFSDDSVSTFPQLGFGHLSLNLYWMALEDSDIQTTDDLAGRDVYCLPASWGLRAMTEEMYGNAGLWEGLAENVVNVETSQAASALAEGRAEAFIVYTSNFTQLPSWAQEIDSRVSVRAIEMTDDYVQAAKDFAGAGYQELDEIGGWEQDMQGGDFPKHTWTETYPYYFSPDVDAQAIYDLMEICHNNYESMQEANPTILDWSKPENFTFALTHTDEIPVHPGAADWYEENDAWDDSWTRGDE